MPRPKNKKDLLLLSQANFDKLFNLINSFQPDIQISEFKPGTMNRNIRDVLGHLHEWHLMFLNWYDVGMSDQKPHMPAEGYAWKDLPHLNRKIWEKYRSQDLKVIMKKLEESHLDIQKLIGSHSDRELFTKKLYKWTGSTSLGAYLISTTSSHYDWAYKLIKRSVRQ